MRNMATLLFAPRIQMRFYEAVTPLRSQLAQLGEQRSYLAEELDVHRNKMKLLMEVDERNLLQ